ncbi:MAG: hypothetical protein KA335_15690, partial [Ramlibacter sp.]|nr:hypothetical protein [Ramlibacter sp.]
GYTAVVGRATTSTTFGGAFTQTATNGYALIVAGVGGTGAAIGIYGDWNSTTNARSNVAFLGTASEAASFAWNPTEVSPAPQWASIAASTYAGKFGYLDTFRATFGTSGYAARFGAGASGADTRAVELANGSYAIEVPTGCGSTKLQAFAANGATPQVAYTLNAASSDLSTVVALCNQIRTALINNGVCA